MYTAASLWRAMSMFGFWSASRRKAEAASSQSEPLSVPPFFSFW
jgi:hypothetical protein